MMTLNDWLIKCGCKDTRPVRLSIGKHSFEGCYYTLDSPRIYVIGLWPKFKRVNVALSVTEDSVLGKGLEWYRVAWWNKAENTIQFPADRISTFHPFGSNFMIGPWTHEEPIDKYERFKYLRIPFQILDK